tara:strand:+ start:144 stop:653 length:510 start_codon:yes stop_codon:yes gene_type:complete
MLQTLGQAGDFIGGIGVVVTLIYLAFEIHQNSKQTKVAAAQSIMQSLSDYYRSASETDQLARVVHMGMENLDSLTDAEATQFFFWGFSFFRLVELAHLHYRLGNIPESFWRGQVAHLEGLFAFPGCRNIYERRQNVFSQEFQEFINNTVIQGPPMATGYLDDFLDPTRR